MTINAIKPPPNALSNVERKAAYSSTVKSTLNQSKSFNWCFIGAGKTTYEGPKYSGGFFTYNILNFFKKEKVNRSINNLFSFLQGIDNIDLSGTVVPDSLRKQNPVLITSDEYDLNLRLVKNQKTKAFIIGINEYQIYSLRYSISDANKFKGLLINDLGLKEKDIVFLQNPTKSQLLSQLASFSKELNSTSEVIFYFSGMSYLTKSQGLALLPKDNFDNKAGILLSDVNNYFKTSNNLITFWDSSTGNIK